MPGFRGVWSGRHRSGPLGEQAHALRREVFDALDRTLGDAFPDRGDRRAPALSRHRAQKPRISCCRTSTTKKLVIAELQRMLGPYLRRISRRCPSPAWRLLPAQNGR